MPLHRRSVLLAAATSIAAPRIARAQAWPSRPVTLINPFAAGGQSDAIGRIVAAHLQSRFGQPFTLENRVGAGSTVGAQAVAKSEPDGYTVLFGTTSTFAVAPATFRNAGYDPLTSFAPITIATEGAMVLCAHPGRPFRSVADLVAAAKAKPGTITYASAGNGSLPHILAQLFSSEADVELVHVPYRGGAPAMNDLVSGQVDLMFEQIANVSQNAEAGRIRALFQTAAQRSPLLPGTPTAAQAGLPALSLLSWAGFAAPASTPTQIVNLFATETSAALISPDARALAAKIGVSTVLSGPAAMGERIERELAIYSRVARSARISID